MGPLMYRALGDIVRRVVFWCVGVPAALLFAAYLVAIVVLCTRELWNDRKRRKRREKTDPSL